jgi:hypothetical protein
LKRQIEYQRVCASYSLCFFRSCGNRFFDRSHILNLLISSRFGKSAAEVGWLMVFCYIAVFKAFHVRGSMRFSPLLPIPLELGVEVVLVNALERNERYYILGRINESEQGFSIEEKEVVAAFFPYLFYTPAIEVNAHSPLIPSSLNGNGEYDYSVSLFLSYFSTILTPAQSRSLISFSHVSTFANSYAPHPSGLLPLHSSN